MTWLSRRAPAFRRGSFLIGTAIAEANRIPKRNTLRDFARQADFDHMSIWRESLDRAFAERGYALAWPDGVMEEKKGKPRRDVRGFRKAYAPAGNAYDAILDVNFGYVGYAAAGSGDFGRSKPLSGGKSFDKELDDEIPF